MAQLTIPNEILPDTPIYAEPLEENFNAIALWANSALGMENLADGAVTHDKLANDSVGTMKLQANAVTTPKIQNLAITTDKLDSQAVTSGKVALGAITHPLISDGAVTESKIGTGAVTGSKVAGGVITSAHIQNNTIENWDLADNCVNSRTIADGSVTALQLARQSVHSLTLTSSFSGAAFVEVQNGRAHLFIDVATTGATDTSIAIATLPSVVGRPRTNVFMAVSDYSGTSNVVYVGPDGVIRLHGSATSGRQVRGSGISWQV